MSLPIYDYAGVSEAERAWIERAFGHITLLGQVMQRGREVEPSASLDEVITMDEYTHDVLVRLSDARYLAFDTT